MTRRHSSYNILKKCTSSKYYHKRAPSAAVCARAVSTVNPVPSVFAALITKGFDCLYTKVNANYLAIATVILMVVLSFVLPDISQKIYKTQELKNVKKVLDVMTQKVNKAEVACLTIAKDLCCLQCSRRDGTTETSFKEWKDFSICTSKCMHSTQSEPVQADQSPAFFRRLLIPRKNVSKEITIMSYLYTDSFDKKKSLTEVIKADVSSDLPAEINVIP